MTNTFNYNRLLWLLQTPRGNPQESLTFMRDKVFPKLSKLPGPPVIDAHGNFHLSIGTSRTLFVAHYDTVDPHRAGVKTKQLWTTADTSLLWLNTETTEAGCVLGADDGVGVELLITLAENNVPGDYMWAAEEESGCLGSKGYLSMMTEALLGQKYDRVISFDRKGTTEVITHQMGQECCSPEFAQALCEALGMEHKPSAGGCYTDSEVFLGCVPECTNIAAGYTGAHSSLEELDLVYMERLAQAILKVQWETLPVKRVAKRNRWDDYDYSYKDWDEMYDYRSKFRSHKTFSSYVAQQKAELLMLLTSYPQLAAKAIIELGVADEVINEITDEIYRLPHMQSSDKQSKV